MFKRLLRLILGSYRVALREGLISEEGVSVMGGCNFGSEPYLIRLRRNCRISMNVTFINHDGGTWAFRKDNDKYKHVIKYGKIEVGEYSFIGANSTIMPGVTIGHHCVIGAGSVVTKDVPDGMVAVGVPARVICSTEEYAEKCLAQMPDDFDEEAYLRDKKAYLIERYMKED